MLYTIAMRCRYRSLSEPKIILSSRFSKSIAESEQVYSTEISRTFSILFLVHIFVGLVVSYNATATTKTDDSSKFAFPPHLTGINQTADEQLAALQVEYNAVDLGIDVPDRQVSSYLKEALANATLSNDPTKNQVTVHDGLLRLREAISSLYSPLLKRKLDPRVNVLVTLGATEAVCSSLTAHTRPGDEWILIEPSYSMYRPMIQMVGGIARFTSLKLLETRGKVTGDDWILDRKELESLFNEKTKGIMFNNPVNPAGKVYTYEELQFIANLVVKYNAMVISDDAHEWVTHKPHTSIASLPGMYERTISIGTASKTFGVSGWRVGWAMGSENILNHVKTVRRFAADSAPAPTQEAIADAIEEEVRNFGQADSYLKKHVREARKVRDHMADVFEKAGMRPIVPQGGHCMLIDWTPMKSRLPGSVETAMDFVVWMIKNVGVLGLPATTYYGTEHEALGQSYARFCFDKNNETLAEAEQRLKKLYLL